MPSNKLALEVRLKRNDHCILSLHLEWISGEYCNYIETTAAWKDTFKYTGKFLVVNFQDAEMTSVF